MSDASALNDPYAAVLADLRAKRDRIDQAIATIESIRGDLGNAQIRPDSAGGSAKEEASGGLFLGMTIVDATKKLLAQRRRTMGNGEITSGLRDGGLILHSQEPANTINSVLTRRFKDVGDIVRVSRGVWGLQEWYPHTNFKRKDGTAAPEKRDSDLPETPDPPVSA